MVTVEPDAVAVKPVMAVNDTVLFCAHDVPSNENFASVSPLVSDADSVSNPVSVPAPPPMGFQVVPVPSRAK